EKGYRDYGYDMDNTDTPLEAGLGFAVDFDKPDGFIGRESLLKVKESGPLKRRLVQFLLEDPETLMYSSMPIYRDGARAGHLGSGGYGHTLGGAVGLGYVNHEEGVTSAFINSGRFEIEIQGVRYPAKASLRPMYDPRGLKVRS
ncbi:MAG: glycine cleavage T C-terminal barrel domain-containing protein, partial [Candidatus Promineifilaceae bacterium]